jgi:hypothetical protein
MYQGRIPRPLGVIILAILQIVGSLIGIGFGLFYTAALSSIGLGSLGLAIVAFEALPLIFGIALFTGRNWARILMLIGAVLDIISIVGIIWGIILIWYLRKSNVVAYFKQPK